VSAVGDAEAGGAVLRHLGGCWACRVARAIEREPLGKWRGGVREERKW